MTVSVLGHAVAPPGNWVPVPVCTPDCLPARTSVGGRTGAGRARPDRVARMVGLVVGWVRAGIVAVRLVALVGVLAAAVVGVAVLDGRARQRWVRGCARRALGAVRVRLRTAGGPVPGGSLVVGNHLSWIDVLALYATLDSVRVQAKREVAEWPVIGGVAARTGALFVDRGGLRALPGTVAETASALRAGGTVAVFPEGTTWCGAVAGTFRRAAFQAAIDAAAPVVPVAFVLRDAGGGPGAAGAFVGDQTLWDSLLRALTGPGLVCEMTVLPALPAGSGDRRALASAAGAAVAAVTGVAHPVTGGRRPVDAGLPIAA